MHIVFNHKTRKEIFISYIKDWLTEAKSVIDVGCGGGEFSEWLMQQGYKTTSIDVKNKSRTKSINPIIYNGTNIPYADNSFDLALLFTVLHHTPNPELVIKEVLRVAKRVIIIEDVFANKVEKVICIANCSVANREFRGHPHSNKSDIGWKQVFTNNGWKLIDSKSFQQLFFGVPLNMGLYHVEGNSVSEE